MNYVFESYARNNELLKNVSCHHMYITNNNISYFLILESFLLNYNSK